MFVEGFCGVGNCCLLIFFNGCFIFRLKFGGVLKIEMSLRVSLVVLIGDGFCEIFFGMFCYLNIFCVILVFVNCILKVVYGWIVFIDFVIYGD